jgi:hypothetical protein
MRYLAATLLALISAQAWANPMQVQLICAWVIVLSWRKTGCSDALSRREASRS